MAVPTCVTANSAALSDNIFTEIEKLFARLALCDQYYNILTITQILHFLNWKNLKIRKPIVIVHRARFRLVEAHGHELCGGPIIWCMYLNTLVSSNPNPNPNP